MAIHRAGRRGWRTAGRAELALALLLGAPAFGQGRAAELDELLTADVSVVVGLRPAALVQSPLYDWYRAELSAADRLKIDETLEGVGLDLRRDVDELVAVVSAPSAEHDLFVARASGRFDPYLVGTALEHAPGVSWRPFAGTTLYQFDEGSEPATFALRGESTLLLGRRSDVQRVLGGAPEGERPEPAAAALLQALADVPGGGDLWWVSDERFAALLPLAALKGAGPGLKLPPLKGLVLSVELGSKELLAELWLEAADAVAARQLGDAVRGLLALARMQPGQPDLQRVLATARVTTDGTRVKLLGKAEYAQLEVLRNKTKPRPQEPAATPPRSEPAAGAPIQ